jgi:hypothetical protein
MELSVKTFALLLVCVLFGASLARTNSEYLAGSAKSAPTASYDRAAEPVEITGASGKRGLQRTPSTNEGTVIQKSQQKLGSADGEAPIDLGIAYVFLAMVLISGMYGMCIVRPELAHLYSGREWLQYTALLLIVTVIVFLGIAKVLIGNQIAPLIGAIAGYLLGRSTDNASSLSNVGSARQG